MRAQSWIALSGCQALEKAIESAESRTECEFVCAVATRSSAYEASVRWWSLLGAVVGVLTAGSLIHHGQDSGSWAPLDTLQLTPTLFGLVLGFLGLGALARRSSRLLLMFTSSQERETAVARSAGFVFSKHHVSHTENRVGVLLYVSLAERELVVIADRAVHDHLGQENLRQLVKAGTERLARGERELSLIEVVNRAVDLLESKFPHLETDQNELKNHLVCIHPHP